MASGPEIILCRELRTVLSNLPNGKDIPDTAQFRKALCALYYFLPEVLAEVYYEWRFQGLDGIYPLVARKTGDAEAEVFGLCDFVLDQTLTPVHVCLQIAVTSDEVSWMECKLGERGDHGGMVRTPHETLNKRLWSLHGRESMIEWVYKVTFGEKRRDLLC